MKPTKKEVARAKALLRDPAYKLAFVTHGILSHGYANMSRTERHAIYAQARIPEMIARAEKRVARKAKEKE